MKQVSWSKPLSSSIPSRSMLIGERSQRPREIFRRNSSILEVYSRVLASRGAPRPGMDGRVRDDPKHPTAKHNAIPNPATIVEWVFLSPVPIEALPP